ncbi:biotin/lipoyl attachment [Lucifera butyrica]|uniref:Biotin/lipoyl attachment n=1 Tax=Lucifera butyrica TaxID=1351585 RepID=A0A498RJP1_9FIRM|nr:biotin/lipoyl-binding protein [Lucifera butyrica]VBB09248.1 biotin/lipoyl attachment [Lucifera butyrica]
MLHNHRRRILLLTVILLVIAAAWAAASNTYVDQKGVLAGRVLAQGLVSVGANVREGDILVFVDTITGPIPAVRANTDGRVRQVLVSPGDNVRTGEVLVRIEPARK